MNMDNFKQIVDLREKFAQNREKAKLNFAGFGFEKREELMDKNFDLKKDLLEVEDSFHEKRHGRNVKEIMLRRT